MHGRTTLKEFEIFTKFFNVLRLVTSDLSQIELRAPLGPFCAEGCSLCEALKASPVLDAFTLQNLLADPASSPSCRIFEANDPVSMLTGDAYLIFTRLLELFSLREDLKVMPPRMLPSTADRLLSLIESLKNLLFCCSDEEGLGIFLDAARRQEAEAEKLLLSVRAELNLNEDAYLDLIAAQEALERLKSSLREGHLRDILYDGSIREQLKLQDTLISTLEQEINAQGSPFEKAISEAEKLVKNRRDRHRFRQYALESYGQLRAKTENLYLFALADFFLSGKRRVIALRRSNSFTKDKRFMVVTELEALCLERLSRREGDFVALTSLPEESVIETALTLWTPRENAGEFRLFKDAFRSALELS